MAFIKSIQLGSSKRFIRKLKQVVTVSPLENYIATTLAGVPSSKRNQIAAALTSASAGRPYTPESIVDLLATASVWWSFDNLSCFQDTAATTPTPIGQPIGRINPWIGSLTATQSNNALRPVLNAEGASFLRSSGQFLAFSGASFIGSRYTIFSAFSRASSQSLNAIIGGTENTSSRNLQFMFDNSTAFRLGQYNSDTVLTVPAYTSPIKSIATGRNSDTGRTVRVNNLSNSSALTTTLNAFGGAGIGRVNTSGSNQFFTGDIYDLIFFFTALTDLDVEKVERFLNFYRSVGLF